MSTLGSPGHQACLAEIASLAATAEQKKALGEPLDAPKAKPRLRSVALGRLRRIVQDWGAEETAAMLATLRQGPTGGSVGAKVGRMDPPAAQGPVLTIRRDQEDPASLGAIAERKKALADRNPIAVIPANATPEEEDEAHRIAAENRRYLRREATADRSDPPQMDILDRDPVTLSPEPGPGRVPVLKDGGALYATRGQALDRALAAGWELAPGATREGDGELVEGALRSAIILWVPRDEKLLAAVQVAFDLSGFDEETARDLCARFRVDPETGKGVS